MSEKRPSRSKSDSQQKPPHQPSDVLIEDKGEGQIRATLPPGRIENTSEDFESKVTEQIIADHVTADNSFVGIIHSQAVELNNCIIGIASSHQPNLQGAIGVSIGQESILTDSRAGVVVAREVKSNHIQSVLLIAGKVEGPVEVLVDYRSIAIFGAVVGAILGVFFSLFRLLRGR